MFFVFEEGERRRRRHRQGCIFNRKSKDKNREMNKGVGKTKQGTEKMGDSSLSILSPLSLPSLVLFEIRKTKRNYENRRRVRRGTEEIGREEGYDEVRQGPRARSHPLLTLPLLYHTSSFLVFNQNKR